MPDGAQKRQGDSTAPQGVVASVYQNANVSVASGGVVLFNSRLFDPFSWYNAANGRWTPLIPGFYRVSFSVRDNNASGWSRAQLRKNGSAVHDGTFQTANPGSSHGTAVVYLNGTGDYIDVTLSRSDGAAATVVGGTSEHTYMDGELVATNVPNIDLVARGKFSTWNWTNNSASTSLSIPHGLGTTPSGAIVSSLIRGSEATTDNRAPWQVAITGLDATNINVVVVTRDKTVIGGFAANEPIYWQAWR